MKKTAAEAFALALRNQRAALFKEVQDTEADLDFIAQDRESEMEERAQEERAARTLATLDERGRRELEGIDAALERIGEETYGVCMGCGGEIPVARLTALPATPFCIECARERESSTAPIGASTEEGNKVAATREPTPGGR